MYRIIHIPDEASEMTEPLGSKRKFWYQGKQRLFKASTPATGEHWAEKAACELCGLLDLPHADYMLANWRDQAGIVAQTIVPAGGQLVLGNELLAEVHESYPASQTRRVKEYTLTRIHALMGEADWRLPPGRPLPAGVTNTFGLFCGYLLLDAWIANQDRHHENWGIIVTRHGETYLAPTFDHAACLGQNERDQTRLERLNTRDRNRHIEYYVTKAKSAFYDSGTNKPLSTVDAFLQAARLAPAAGRAWLRVLSTLDASRYHAVFSRFPPEICLSAAAQTFAIKMLELNRTRLLALREHLS